MTTARQEIKQQHVNFFEEFNNVYGNRASTRGEVTYDSSAKRKLLSERKVILMVMTAALIRIPNQKSSGLI